jgi:hypothetical protein
MMNQDSLFGFFELFGCQFFFQEVHLLVTQPGKVVQTIIHPVVIRFVFTAVQHDEANGSIGESIIEFTVGAGEVSGEVAGICSAGFVIASCVHEWLLGGEQLDRGVEETGKYVALPVDVATHVSAEKYHVEVLWRSYTQ